MPALPFRLRVPSRDESNLLESTSISFKFRGLMQLEADALYIEWTGSYKTEAHGLLDTESSVKSLPLESIDLPYDQIRLMELRGGWWWPHVALAANTLDGLRAVPSEEAGLVKFHIARSDRKLAADLIAAVMAERHV